MEDIRSKREKICDTIIWTSTVLLITAIGLFDGHEWMQILMYLFTGITGILILLKEGKKFRLRIELYHVFIAVFICVCYVSGISALDSASSYITSGYVLRMFICMSVFYYYYEKQQSINPLLQAIKWGGYLLAYLSLIGYNPRNIIDILLNGGRVYNEFMCHIGDSYNIKGLFYGIFSPNINYLGMQIAIAAVIGVFDIVYQRKNLVVETIAILPALLLVAVSGGKMNYLIVFLGVCCILLQKTKHSSVKVTLQRWSLLLVGAVTVVMVLSYVPSFRTTLDRFVNIAQNLLNANSNMPQDQRITMIQIGLREFLKNPIIGIGIDNSYLILEQAIGRSTYFHCNYVELLAGVGVLGTCVYYMVYVYALYQFWKYRDQKDIFTNICIILLIISLVADVAIVTYSIRLTYLYSALLFIQVKKLKNKH